MIDLNLKWRNYLKISLIVIVCIILSSCNKEKPALIIPPPIIEPEPEFTAEFKIFDSFSQSSGIDELVEEYDKILPNTNTYFKPNYVDADKYIWVLNGDTLPFEKGFYFRFYQQAFERETHFIELYVEKKLEKDSIVSDRYQTEFKFAQSYNELKTVGIFEGFYADAPFKKQMVEIGYGNLNGKLNVNLFYMVGFKGLDADTLICYSDPLIYVTNSKAHIVDMGGSYKLDFTGVAEISNNRIKLNYTINEKGYSFYGKKKSD